MAEKPAVSLVAVAGRRRATLELAQRIEREGFTGIYCWIVVAFEELLAAFR